MRGQFSVVVLPFVLAVGCSTLSEMERDPPVIPAMQISDGSVGFELATVHVLPEDQSTVTHLWNDVDESQISVELANRLRANGFRCGVIGQQIPESLHEILTAAGMISSDDREVGSITFESLNAGQLRRMSMRKGQRREIATTSQREESTVWLMDHGELKGNRRRQAQAILAMSSTPLADGRVRVVITPEIQHGPLRRKIEGHSGIFRQQIKRQSDVFESLTIEASLSPGETLLVTHAPGANGLGAEFFQEESGGKTRQKIVLLRLIKTDHDALF